MTVAPPAQPTTLQLMQSRTYRAWVLGLLALIAMFGFIDRQIISGLGQAIKLDLHISDGQLGLLGGLAFALLNSVLTIPVARVADRRRRITIMGVGLFLWSLATCACGLAHSFVQLLAARVAVGVGETAGMPIATSVVADYFPRERRTSAVAFYVLSVPLGALIGAAGGGFVAQHANWRMAFVAAGAPGLILAVILALSVREPIRGIYDAPGAADQAAPSLAAVLRRMAQRPGFLHVTAGATLASMGGFGINLFLAPYFNRRFGLDYAQSGLLSGLISAIPGTISMLGGGLLTDALGRRDARFYAWVPGLGALLAAPLYLISFLQTSWAAAAALLMVTGIVQYTYLPASVGVTQNAMEPKMRATAAALVAIMTNLVAGGLGPLLVGSLSDVFAKRAPAAGGSLQWASMATALVYVWSAAHFALAARTLKRDLA